MNNPSALTSLSVVPDRGLHNLGLVFCVVLRTSSGDRLAHQRDKLNLRYSLAKTPPHPNLTVEKLTQKFGTTNFLTALSSFLRCNLPGTTITPSIRDRFDAYKQIILPLPTNQYLSDHIVDRVRTSPSVNASGRLLLKASHFDTAFIVEDLPLYNLEGGLSGFFFSLIIIN